MDMIQIKAGILPVEFLPNRDGFRFIGYTDAGRVDGIIKRGEDGLHRCFDLNGVSIFRQLKAWSAIK